VGDNLLAGESLAELLRPATTLIYNLNSEMVSRHGDMMRKILQIFLALLVIISALSCNFYKKEAGEKNYNLTSTLKVYYRKIQLVFLLIV
jgi:hypothetical protein